jgi:hypothetical protein
LISCGKINFPWYYCIVHLYNITKALRKTLSQQKHVEIARRFLRREADHILGPAIPDPPFEMRLVNKEYN